MGKNIVRITSNKKEAEKEAKAITISLQKRNINRETYVCGVSKSYVKKRTRKGYPISKKNYGVCMRNR